MYKAKNGFTLKDNRTADGWEIKSPQDIITALLVFPEFQTVYDGFLWEALKDAMEDRKEYESISDLAGHIAANYI